MNAAGSTEGQPGPAASRSQTSLQQAEPERMPSAQAEPSTSGLSVPLDARGPSPGLHASGPEPGLDEVASRALPGRSGLANSVAHPVLREHSGAV